MQEVPDYLSGLDLLDTIRRYVELQSFLVAEFRANYPQVEDLHTFAGAPATGCLDTPRGFWLFKKHGAGLAFTDADAVRIDVHREARAPELFDTWRILLFIESSGEGDNDISFEQLEYELNRLAIAGEIIRCPERLFRLPSVAV